MSSQHGEINSFWFWKDKDVVYNKKLSQVAFLKSNQQLGNSANKISSPITFCDLKKVWAIESEQNNLVLVALKHYEKTENDISCILLTFSCWCPCWAVERAKDL